ncbi:MAG: hypothetical protein QXQ48_04730 [Nitrososphaerota archaeon]
MSLYLQLELRLLFASFLRVAVPIIVPLAPLALRYAGVLSQDLVEPSFILLYQFLAMTYLPLTTGLVRGGWRLAWLLRPPDSALLLTASYTGLLAATSALPIAAYRLLIQLSGPMQPGAQVIILTLSIGILHQSLALLCLSTLRDMTAGWAALLTYQAILLTLAANLLTQGLSGAHLISTPLFPALLAIAPQAPPEVLYTAAALCIASSLLFTYLAARSIVRPASPWG